MGTILVRPKDVEELKLISDLFSKMKVKIKVLTSDETEDLLFRELMKAADRSQKVSRNTIMNKLKK